MSRLRKYAIHPDFEQLPVFNMRFNGLVVGLLNMLMRLTRWFSRGIPGAPPERHVVARPDGTYDFDFSVMDRYLDLVPQHG